MSKDLYLLKKNAYLHRFCLFAFLPHCKLQFSCFIYCFHNAEGGGFKVTPSPFGFPDTMFENCYDVPGACSMMGHWESAKSDHRITES